MRRTLPSQLFRPEQCGGFSGRITGTHQGGVANELLTILSSTPGCLEEFWSAIEPAFNAGIIHQAAKEIRSTVSLIIRDAAHLPDHLKWLDEQEFSREDNRQIRYIVEMFFHAEPCQAVLAAVAYRWILGMSSSCLAVSTPRYDGHTMPRFDGTIKVTGDNTIQPCLSPVIARFGLPVHSFFRAVAVWPDYLHQAWADLDILRCDTVYPAMLADVKQSVDDAGRRIPVCKGVSIFSLKILDVARLLQQYLDVSCEVILYVAALRRMFIRSETLARNRRIKESLLDKEQ